MEEKFTPQGRRVPDTPPPSDEVPLSAVPPWPWGDETYERSTMDGPCLRSWGPIVYEVASGTRRENGYNEDMIHGNMMKSRMT